MVENAFRQHLATGKIEGGLAFIGIYDKLREKGFSQAQSVEGALDGADHIVRLEEAQRQVSKTQTPALTLQVVAGLVSEYMSKTGTPHPASVAGPAAHPGIITEEAIRGIATDAARKALAAQPKEPTFEDSLTPHERECPTCREDALNKWNKKGVK